MKAHLTTGLFATVAFIAAMSLNSTVTYTRYVEAEEQTAAVASAPLPSSNIVVSEGFSEVSAESVLVVDERTGKILYERSADTLRPIASISKLFTAYVLQRSVSLDDNMLTITAEDVATEEVAGNLRAGEEYTFREILFPLLLVSSNDAGTAIMRTIGEEKFAAELNKLRIEAGLAYTQIIEPTGLSPENRSTARELVKFMQFLEERAPYILSITTLTSYQGTLKGWQNNIPGREYESFQGGKHGYIPEADGTFVGVFEKDGERFIIMLLGSEGLRKDLAAVADMLE